MAIYQLGEHRPTLHPSVYVAESADVIGRVTLSQDVSIWSNATIRGDNDDIFVGEGTNIQESSVLHVDAGTPMRIGAHVNVGHQAMLHGCTIGDHALIGMQAIVLNGAVIGNNVLIGAGALIPEGKVIPDNVLVIGIGKIQRELRPEEIEGLRLTSLNYIERAKLFATQLKRIA